MCRLHRALAAMAEGGLRVAAFAWQCFTWEVEGEKEGVGGRLIDEHTPGGVMPFIGNDNVYIIYFLLPSARFIYRIT